MGRENWYFLNQEPSQLGSIVFMLDYIYTFTCYIFTELIFLPIWLISTNPITSNQPPFHSPSARQNLTADSTTSISEMQARVLNCSTCCILTCSGNPLLILLETSIKLPQLDFSLNFDKRTTHYIRNLFPTGTKTIYRPTEEVAKRLATDWIVASVKIPVAFIQTGTAASIGFRSGIDNTDRWCSRLMLLLLRVVGRHPSACLLLLEQLAATYL